MPSYFVNDLIITLLQVYSQKPASLHTGAPNRPSIRGLVLLFEYRMPRAQQPVVWDPFFGPPVRLGEGGKGWLLDKDPRSRALLAEQRPLVPSHGAAIRHYGSEAQNNGSTHSDRRNSDPLDAAPPPDDTKVTPLIAEASEEMMHLLDTPTTEPYPSDLL